MIRIIVVDPKKEAKTMLVDETKDFVRELVGKNATWFRPYDDPVSIIYNPSNASLNMPKCRAYTELIKNMEKITKIFYGRFIIVQENEDNQPTNFDSVLCRAYKALFLYPESFRKVNGHWAVSEIHGELPTRQQRISV